MKHTEEAIQQLANCIRFLAVDGVQRASSGHPGMPLGMADIAAVLFANHININPKQPAWINRDRFVLSNGHGSMLLYALNHLVGYDLSLEDLKAFRQLNSKTPGHPEHDLATGVETTTGPLGQGLANAVGMAMAQKHLSDAHALDYQVYCFVGDGCLMEGISQEAISLAGTWQLDNLIVIWDDNGISIDGQVEGWFNENVTDRFRACHWQVIENVDGHDIHQIDQAIARAKDMKGPVLIQAKTEIGRGLADLAGTAKVHGAPAGEEAIAQMRKDLSWQYAPFEVPAQVWETITSMQNRWQAHFQSASNQSEEIPVRYGDWQEIFATAAANQDAMATRAQSQKVIGMFESIVEPLMLGSADLTESNLTTWPGAQAFSQEEPQGRYINFGVREFGMFAIANGLALSGILPAVGTFLTFMDYGRNAMRLAAMMKLPVTYVLTHDSCGLGEDGPTHQPVEHLAILRATPGLNLWRPASLLETAVAWQSALQAGPSALALSRQKVVPLKHSLDDVHKIRRGAYIHYQTTEEPAAIIFSSGSELATVMAHVADVEEKVGSVRVVSVPCMDIFFKQDAAYQDEIMAKHITNRVVFEAACLQPWYKMVGEATMIGIDDYGVSAPGQEALSAMGVDIQTLLQALESNQLVSYEER